MNITRKNKKFIISPMARITASSNLFKGFHDRASFSARAARSAVNGLVSPGLPSIMDGGFRVTSTTPRIIDSASN